MPEVCCCRNSAAAFPNQTLTLADGKRASTLDAHDGPCSGTGHKPDSHRKPNKITADESELPNPSTLLTKWPRRLWKIDDGWMDVSLARSRTEVDWSTERMSTRTLLFCATVTPMPTRVVFVLFFFLFFLFFRNLTVCFSYSSFTLLFSFHYDFPQLLIEISLRFWPLLSLFFFHLSKQHSRYK